MSSIKKNVRIRTIATCRNIFVRACLIATCRNQKIVAKCRNKCLAWKRRLANPWTEKIVLTPSTFTIWFWKIWSSLWQMVCSFHFFNTLCTYKNLIIFFSLYLDMLLETSFEVSGLLECSQKASVFNLSTFELNSEFLLRLF